MKKTISLGKVDYNNNGRQNCPVTIEVSIENGRLSICGNVWMPSRTDIYSGGQNHDTILEMFPNSPAVARLVEVWKRWHLNDMRPTCEHQRELGWEEKGNDLPLAPAPELIGLYKQTKQTSYSRPSETKTLGWLNASEHPEGLLGRPCPVCGYKYGTAWKTEPLPAEIIAEVEGWTNETFAPVVA